MRKIVTGGALIAATTILAFHPKPNIIEETEPNIGIVARLFRTYR